MIEIALNLQSELESILNEETIYAFCVFCSYSFGRYYFTIIDPRYATSLEEELAITKLYLGFENRYPEYLMEFMKYDKSEWFQMYNEGVD